MTLTLPYCCSMQIIIFSSLPSLLKLHACTHLFTMCNAKKVKPRSVGGERVKVAVFGITKSYKFMTGTTPIVQETPKDLPM